jgi:hypothetical protein
MLELPREERTYNGNRFAHPSGKLLFQAVYKRHGKINCSNCGWKATHFNIERHKNDRMRGWTMNLMGEEGDGSFAKRERADRSRIQRLFTQDHIVPVSLGGTDVLENLRCMCERCNSKRGNNAPIQELLLSLRDPSTYDDMRVKAYQKFQNSPLDQLIWMAEHFDEEVPKN